MQLAAAALVLTLALLASSAAAQTAQPVSVVPGVVAQASFDNGYLIAKYMEQLAAAGNAPVTQADLEAAAREYFTNGAAATGVPTSGPGAEYFTNGAAATSVPTSGPGAEYFTNGAEVMSYSSSSVATTFARAEAPPVAVERRQEVESAPSGAPVAVPSAPVPLCVSGGESAPEVLPRSEAATTPACSRQDLEAAMAIGSVYAGAEAQKPETCAPCEQPAACPPARPCEEGELSRPPPLCPTPPSLWRRVAPGLGGAFLGALAMALLSIPRQVRSTRRRNAV